MPRVLVAEMMLKELGREMVTIASDAFAIPAFDTTSVSVKLAPTETWLEEIVAVIDRSTVEAPLKFAA